MRSKEKKSNKISLSDKIANALTLKPKADIEDDHIFNTKPNTVSRADLSSSDSEDEAVISDFRKRNVNLLSEISKKYDGLVVSRKDFDIGSDDFSDEKSASNDESDDDDNESDDYSIMKIRKQNISDSDAGSIENYSSDTEINENRDNSGVGSDENGEVNSESGLEEDDGGYDISQMETPMQENFEHVKKQNISEEAKKGICVRNQLLLWESLLEMRIHLQKCLNSANKMPFPELCEKLKQSKDFAEESQVVINNVSNALHKLLTVQSYLLRKFPETKSLSSTKEVNEYKQNDETDEEIQSDTDNEEIPSDTENEEEIEHTKIKPKENVIFKSVTKKRRLSDYENKIADCHKKFKSFKDLTIQKWNEKTRVATAAIINTKSAPSNTILQQISYILSDRNKLIQRTQLKRSDYDIIGHKTELIELNEGENVINPITKDRKDNDEYIPEIFDDSDFYHQLLRELIECKSTDISDPIQLSRQWITLQQMRSKMKRKVDTKATKGRKIKYVVHNKLVNFMAPEKSAKWNEESTNELYSSLFGKMFEQNNVGLNVNLDKICLK